MKWDRTKGRPEPIKALNRIREVDQGEPLVDMRLACPSLVKMRDGTIPWCRRTVAEMAERAAQALPPRVKLGYSDAWRPFERQVAIYEWMWQKLEEARPGLPYAQKRRIVCKWVAPVDQPAPPGHCTGAALDVHLLDDEGQPLDVSSPFDRFSSAATYTFGLTDRALANRTTLVETMIEAGFSNCRDEYWHYSYGDAGWAVRTGRDTCVYGRAELDPAEWRSLQDLWLTTLDARPNPFLA